MRQEPSVLVEFRLYRHGDSLVFPRIGLMRSPCRFRVTLNELNPVLEILRGHGYKNDEYSYKILNEKIERKPFRGTTLDIFDSVKIPISGKLGEWKNS